MFIVSQERITFDTTQNNETKAGLVNVMLYSDTEPNTLELTGADIGIDGDICPGSILLTPSARYIYSEEGAFTQVTW